MGSRRRGNDEKGWEADSLPLYLICWNADCRDGSLQTMVRDELIKQMRLEGIPLDMLWSQTGVPSECFVMRERHGAWEVFYAERGLETGLITFPTEDAACHALLDKMRSDAVASGYSGKPSDS